MKKLSVLLFVVACAAHPLAGLNTGVGIYAVNSGYGEHSSSVNGSTNTFQGGILGAIPLGESAELDPSVSVEFTTASNPNSISGITTDQYNSQLYSVGAKYLLSKPLGQDFRLLGGVGANVGFGSINYAGMTGTYSRLSGTFLVPVALELVPLPHFGFRLQATLGSVSLSSNAHKTTGTYTYENGTITFGSSTVGLAAFYYF